MRVAFIDLGTNTHLLLIAEISGDGVAILEDTCEIARLGEGIESSQNFCGEAIERSLSILSFFKQTIDVYGCDEVITVGTAACRLAQNSSDYANKLKERFGFELDIISGDQEASLIHHATAQSFKDIDTPRLILDIGGGSTEFIFEPDLEHIQAESLDFGSVKLTERFLHGDPPTPKEIHALKHYVKNTCQKFLPNFAPKHLIATAGTPTTVCALIKDLKHYNHNKVHKTFITLKDFQNLFTKLKALPLEKRAGFPCLPPKRADVILAGMAILETVLELFRFEGFHVSDQGLRYGLLHKKISELDSRH